MNVKNAKHLVIDCYSLIYPAFYTTNNLYCRSGSGVMSSGIAYGFLNKLLALAKRFNSNRVYFCWDHHESYRKKAYSEYKQNRDKLTEEEQLDRIDLHKQVDNLRIDILPSMGFRNHFRCSGFEADDLIAKLVSLLNNIYEKEYIVVISTDKDLFQLLDRCNLFNPSSNKLMTQKIFENTYGIKVDQWVDCKAIGGCDSDNVKGIKGVADPAKSVTYNGVVFKLVRGEMKNGVVLKRVNSKEGIEIIERNLPLVTCPYPRAKMKAIITRRDHCSRSKFIKVFDRYAFRSQLEDARFKEWERIFTQKKEAK